VERRFVEQLGGLRNVKSRVLGKEAIGLQHDPRPSYTSALTSSLSYQPADTPYPRPTAQAHILCSERLFFGVERRFVEQLGGLRNVKSRVLGKEAIGLQHEDNTENEDVVLWHSKHSSP
jgi:hypothetical protein